MERSKTGAVRVPIGAGRYQGPGAVSAATAWSFLSVFRDSIQLACPGRACTARNPCAATAALAALWLGCTPLVRPRTPAHASHSLDQHVHPRCLRMLSQPGEGIKNALGTPMHHSQLPLLLCAQQDGSAAQD